MRWGKAEANEIGGDDLVACCRLTLLVDRPAGVLASTRVELEQGTGRDYGAEIMWIPPRVGRCPG